MPSNTENVKLGVCSVTFGGVDLGYTKGGVEVEVVTETKKVMVDQFGNSEINEYIIGRTCKAKVPMAETTLQNLVRIMPGAQLITDGGAKATGKITLKNAAPIENDKVIVNGVEFVFKDSPDPAKPHEIETPESIADAVAALVEAINNSVAEGVTKLVASAGGTGEVIITAESNGVWGNEITLEVDFYTAANAEVSGPTLSGGVDDTAAKVVAQNGIGLSLLDFAKKLVLHPIANAPENRKDDFIMPIAATPGQMNFSFKLDEERVFPVEFTAYPDSQTKLLFVVGDEQASGE